MKKLGLVFRETLESRIKKELKDAQGLFLVRYSKVKSPEMSVLRLSLLGSRSTLFVSKNSILRRALKDSGKEDILKFIDGPCGLVFAMEEPVGTSRALYNFAKEHEQLQLACGMLEDRFLEKKDIEALARIPGKETLRLKAVVALKSPITGCVFVLKQTLSKLAYCLVQIKNKKTG